MKKCPYCKKEIENISQKCEYCKSDLTSKSINIKQIIGVVGSLFIIFGCFAPLANLPIVGVVNYFYNGKGDGVFMIAIAIISIIIIIAEKYIGLYFTGLVSFGIAGYVFTNFIKIIDQTKKNIDTNLSDNPYQGLATLVVGQFRMEWGWIMLFLGAIILLITPLINTNSHKGIISFKSCNTVIEQVVIVVIIIFIFFASIVYFS